VNCRKVNHLLSAYMDGELPGVEHRQIHEHLAHCTECADEYAGLLRMKRLLAGLRVREPRSQMASHIVDHVHRTHDLPRGHISFRWTQQVNGWWRGVGPQQPALALGIGLAVVGVFAVSQLVDGREMLHSYREPIHWSPVSTSAIASHELAPDYPLASSRSDTVQSGMALSNVGYSTANLNLSHDDLSASSADPEHTSAGFNWVIDRSGSGSRIDASMPR
jgi:anti-sigma factor RsiW